MPNGSFFVRWGEWIESAPIQRVITWLIIINAVILGLQTSPSVVGAVGGLMSAVDSLILAVFVAELVIRIGYRRTGFFRDGWNVFDFVVVAIALVPSSAGLSVLRSLRVLRVLRLITAVPRLKLVVRSLLSSLPGLGIIIGLQGLLFYVAAVIATNLFGAAFDEWFGTLGRSLYSLFQIMTLESWSMGIVRPVMEQYPYSWLYFVPFILIATFTMLNLFIAIIVNAMQIEAAEEAKKEEETITDVVKQAASDETTILLAEIRLLREEVAELRRSVVPG